MKPFALFYDYLTEELATEPIPVNVKELARRAIVDTVGVILAGSQQSPLPEITKLPRPGGGKATIVAHGCGYTAAEAALYNGTAAHVLDMDDTGLWLGHPSAVLIPALLALAEENGNSGAEVLRAYIGATTVGNAFGHYCGSKIHAIGWHSTPVEMSPIAALACGVLLGLSKEQLHHAMGIGASMACGLRANFGSPTKPLHAGLAARNAVMAALLAQAGMTAADEAMSGKNGYFKLFSDIDYDEKRVAEISRDMRNPYGLVKPGLVPKAFPSCSSNHQATFALYDLLKTYPDVQAADIERIEMTSNKSTLAELVTPDPKTEVQARFSPGFHFALVLCGEKITPANFNMDMIRRPDIQRIIKMTTLVHAPEYDNIPGIKQWPARVRLFMKDGRVLTKLRIIADGDVILPFTEEQMLDKFLTCATPVVGAESAGMLYTQFRDIERVASIAQLMTYTA